METAAMPWRDINLGRVDERLLERDSWLVHPRPRRGESMESWVIRQALSNGYVLRTFSSLFFHKPDIWRSDYDLIDNTSLQFVSKLIGSPRQASSMTLLSYQNSLGAVWDEAFLKHQVLERDGTKYCPLCFSEDEETYLYLLWRLNFIQICLKHDVLLESTCKRCGSPFRPWRTNSRADISVCMKCGYSMMDTAPLKVDHAQSEAAFELASMVKGGTSPREIGWACNTEEFFEIVFFLSRFLKLVRRGVGPECNRSRFERNPVGVRLQAHLMSELYAKSWRLIRNRQELEEIIRQNQSLFDYTAKWSTCPRLLSDFKSPLNRKMRVELPSIIRRSFGMNEIQRPNLYSRRSPYKFTPHKLEKLQAELYRIINVKPVSHPIELTYVAMALGVDPQTLTDNPKLSPIIEEAKARSSAFFSSFMCPNESQDGADGSKHRLVIRTRYGWRRLKSVPRIELRCITCGRIFSRTLRDVPTHIRMRASD